MEKHSPPRRHDVSQDASLEFLMNETTAPGNPRAGRVLSRSGPPLGTSTLAPRMAGRRRAVRCSSRIDHITIASVMLVALALPMALVAMIVRLTSRSDFYHQESGCMAGVRVVEVSHDANGR
jgi:hypothetical protein